MTRFSFCGCCTSPSSLAFLFPVFLHEDGKSPNQAMDNLYPACVYILK